MEEDFILFDRQFQISWTLRNISNLFYINWIEYIHKQCSSFTRYFCLSIILLTYSSLSVINGIGVRCWNLFWPMNTADSGEQNLLPSNKNNMHKTNTRLQASAEGSNYLCNIKAAETISHVAVEIVCLISNVA